MKARIIAIIARSLADLQRRIVMPTLWWIAFWSLAMGAAACWCEQQPEPLRVRASAKQRPEQHRDHPAV
jgi:hypothetical protein